MFIGECAYTHSSSSIAVVSIAVVSFNVVVSITVALSVSLVSIITAVTYIVVVSISVISLRWLRIELKMVPELRTFFDRTASRGRLDSRSRLHT